MKNQQARIKMNWNVQMMKNLVLLILLLVLITSVSASVSTDKASYYPGEIVTIKLDLDNYNSDSLTIKTVNRVYSYNGNLLSELGFLPQEVGVHQIIYRNVLGETIGQTSFEVVESDASHSPIDQVVLPDSETGLNESNQTDNISNENLVNEDTFNLSVPSSQEIQVAQVLSTNKTMVGKSIFINLTSLEYSKVRISFAGNIYSFQGENKEIDFTPVEAGEYKLIVYGLPNQDGVISTTEYLFLVEQDPRQMLNAASNPTYSQPLVMEHSDTSNKSRKISYYREQIDKVSQDAEITVTFFIYNELNASESIKLVETIPDNWQIINVPESADVQNNKITFSFDWIEEKSTRVVNYTVKAPNYQDANTFSSTLTYTNKSEQVQLTETKNFEVISQKSYFDTTIDLYDKDDEITRDLIVDHTYNSNIKIRNLGEEVSDYPVFARWYYDKEAFRVQPTSSDCTRKNNDGQYYLECQFKDFKPDETRQVWFKLTTLKEGIFNNEVEVLYDPPLTEIFNDVWTFFKKFFSRLYEALSGTITGQVISEQPQSNQPEENIIYQEDEPLPEPITLSDIAPKEETVENGEPIIVDINPSNGRLRDPIGEVECLARDDDVLDYTLEMEVNGNWQTLCYVRSCQYDLTNEDDSEVRFRCTVEDEEYSISDSTNYMTYTKPRLSISNVGQSGGAIKKSDKIWVTTKTNFLVRVRDQTSTITLVDVNNNPINHTAKVIATRNTQRQDIEVEFVNKNKVQKIQFYNLNPSTKSLSIEEHSQSKQIFGRQTISSFAINPEAMDFETADVTVQAQAQELWKCKDWNYTTQTCFGAWEKLLDIKPGENYTFELTPKDPGYAETGLSTINTNQSIYYTNQQVELIAVVLDPNGFLVKNANVTINVTKPNNTTLQFKTDDLTLTESTRGVYTAIFTDTAELGDYAVNVYARALNVNSSMSSFFKVDNSYEFDIFRNVPATIDPFSGPINSSIKIVTRTTIANFNITEKIPRNFSIRQANGATITSDATKKYLTWTNLNNNSVVNYTVQVPLITPELWELGQAKIYSNLGEFIEYKPWYLAVDPLGIVRPTAFTDVNAIGTSEGNAYDDDFTTSATIDLDSNANPRWVEYTTFDTAGLNGVSTINSLNVTFSISISGTVSNDNWYLEYSTNGGTGYTNCITSSATVGRTNYTCAVAGLATIADLANLQVRVGGDRDGTADGIAMLVYEIWAGINYTPPNSPPTPVAIAKNATSIYVNDSVTFNTTWFDIDNDNLDTWIFSWNASGVWENVSSSAFVASNLSSVVQNANASEGTNIGWRFYANDTNGDFNATPIQSFVVLGIDLIPPTVSNLAVTPTSALSGNQFNLSATITDNSVITNAWAEVMLANGQRTNYSMSLVSGSTYSTIYTSNQGGNLSFVVYAFDGSNFNVSDQRQYFNVTANISATKYYYGRGETVDITGYGFSPNSTLNINVIDVNGNSISGYPTTTTSDTNGDVSVSWNIPSLATFEPGNFTIHINDSAMEWLGSSDEVRVVIKPTTARALTDSSPGQIESNAYLLINDSDNIYSNVVGSNSEVFLETNFSSVVPAGYNVDSAVIYFEYYQVSTDAMNVDWYNETAAAYQTLCTFAANTSETWNYCDITGRVPLATDVNDLSIRFSDANGANNGENWTMFDFVYLDVQSTISNTLAITINDPSVTQVSYDFGDGTHSAYDGGDTTNPLPVLTRLAGTSASAAEITNLTADDAARFHTFISGNTGERAYQSFNFVITDSVVDITSMQVVHDGFATGTTSQSADPYYIYLWNYTSSAYDLILSAGATSTDETTNPTVQGNNSDYINVSSGEVWVLIIGDHRTGGGGNAQADLFTDYIALNVNKVTVISGLQDINATVTDGDGVDYCTYYYQNSTGSIVSPYIGMANYTNNIWYNVSDTTVYPDGFYYLYVNCTDVPGTDNINASIYVKIANAAPSIQLIQPLNYTNFTYSNINFTFIANQASPGLLTCNLTVDNVDVQTGISATSGQNTTVNESIADGFHNWTVSCVDSSGLTNTSEAWVFDVDTTAPTINLNRPSQYYYTNETSLGFNYTPVDAHNITSCSLIINGLTNQTNTTIVNNTFNNFTAGTFAEGLYNWSVNCTDSFGLTGNSSLYNFTIDFSPPSLSLDYPPEAAVLSGGNVTFNFTTTDVFDGILNCNLSVDGAVTNSNFTAISGGVTNISRTGLIDGTHNWSVSCWDNVLNINYSEMRNFTMSAPPGITLIDPANGNSTNNEPINFTYYVADGDGIANCSFYWNGQLNQTQGGINITNFGNNTFNLSNVPEGRYNWTVSCTDNTSSASTATPYNVTVDRTMPNVTLYGPLDNVTITNTTVYFNFTVTDALDSNLTCNLTIDGTASATNNNFPALNGTTTNITETGVADGLHNWSISCWDDAINVNISEERNFTLDTFPTVNLVTPSQNNVSNNNVTFVYYVSDIGGISTCSLLIDDIVNQTNVTAEITNPGNNNFVVYNISEGLHNWSVNCTDASSLSTIPNGYNITIDMTPPTVVALNPNGTAFSSGSVNFNFSVTDALSSTMNCNVSVDNGAYSTVVAATNGSITNTNIGSIADGAHNWNVTCYDEASNFQTSNSLNFTVDGSPQVFLDAPAAGYGDLDGNLTFTYEVDDGNLTNCSLVINDVYNQTINVSGIPHIGDGFTNNFTLNNTAQGVYNWTVICFDVNGFNGTEAAREFHVDSNAPNNVTLNDPLQNETLYVSTILFNWTVYDAVDPNLLCNLTINGQVNQTNINSANGTPTTQSVSGFSAGNYTWNVSCADNSGLANYSETRTFNVSSDVRVTLTRPVINYTDADGNLDLFYIPESIEDFDGAGFCELIFDGTPTQTNVTPIVGVENAFTVTGVSAGLHNWSVNCTDNIANNGISENYSFYVDLIAPNISLNSPNAQTFNISTVILNWTVTDNLDQDLSCNVTIDLTEIATNVNSTNASQTTYEQSGLNDSIHFWNVTCADDGGRSNYSVTYNFTILEPPRVWLIGPSNSTRTNVVNQSFIYTPYDNSGAVNNCTLIINDLDNQTNTSINDSLQNNFSLIGLSDGTYVWDVNCTDAFSNYAVNGTANTLFIDLSPPDINLTYPPNDQTFNQNNIDFNWTPTDFEGTTINCNISVTDPLGTRNVTNISGISGTNFNATFVNLSDGVHYWNVSCVDDLGNANTSVEGNFTINQPDLYLNNSGITFNNSNPDLFENITITANVTNIGGSNANNVLVEFWDGTPGSGIYIGNDTASVLVNESILFNVSWLITPGYNNIYVNVDPLNSIDEENESNNNATTTISVLQSNITSPINNTWVTNATFPIQFVLEDFTAGLINYTIYLDGVSTGQTGQVTDNVTTPINVSLGAEGVHYVYVTALDSLGRLKNSTRVYVTYDATSPTTNFETINGTFFSDTTPQILFNFTDNLASTINYTYYVDAISDGFNSTPVDTTTDFNLSVLSEGRYNITIQATDEAGNSLNNSIFIFVDQTVPSINLTSPFNGENVTVTYATLTYVPTDNLDELLTCNVSLDGSVVNASMNITNGTSASTYVSGLSEGVHTWNVTCWDGRDNQNIVNTNTSETYTFNIYIPPRISLLNPINNSWNNTATNIFYFNASDDSGLNNCSIRFDGIVNQTKTAGQLNNAGISNFTVSGLNGTYVWDVECYDTSSANAYNVSNNRTINVDLDDPIPRIETLNGTWFNTGNPSIDFNITDNMDTLLNYSFYVNQLFNVDGQVANATSSSTNLVGLNNGSYVLELEGLDEAGNRRNSSNITIFVDTVEPTITLHYPEIGNTTNGTNVYFNWTTTDNLADVISCNLTIDGTVQTSINQTNGTDVNRTYSLTAGIHYWNVTCIDYAGNVNTSETRNFTVPAPDLFIQSVYITFNNSSPQENETITINATVENIGNTDAGAFTVQFYTGDPDGSGTQINGDIAVTNLSSGNNISLNVSYNAQIGINTIFVLVDTPLASNGSINEDNESNNEANNTFIVEQFHIVAGSTNDELRITDNSYVSLFEWNSVNLSGSNIYVADTDSLITWSNLQAIGQNTTNQSTTNDFEEIDDAFGSENYTDSINATYTSAGVPKLTDSFTVFDSSILNVPVVNSTNTSDFQTGILWDYNDGGTEYNGTQDLVFITRINENKTGQFGTYDYEIKIPAPLRAYKGGTQTVTFYTEIV